MVTVFRAKELMIWPQVRFVARDLLTEFEVSVLKVQEEMNLRI
jgi:hypothetical protein